jgi:hypothetical protein
MAGSRFGRPFDKHRPVAPVLMSDDILDLLCHLLGAGSAPVQARRRLDALRQAGEDVLCLVDDGHFFVVSRAELPAGMDGPDED